MRWVGPVALALVLTLALPLPLTGSAHGARDGPPSLAAGFSPAVDHTPGSSAALSAPVLRPTATSLLAREYSLSAAATAASRGLAGPVDSAIFETPAPRVPPTVPTVVTFAANSTNCCVQTNFTPPAGTWGAIVLNYTGAAVNGVYDSSYRAYVDGVQVLFGTTPEYGRWIVRQDLTPYLSLFNGTTNLTFILGAAVTTGYFLVSVSLEFYPVANGAAPPVVPTLIVPVFSRQFVRAATPTISSTVHLPSNVTSAELEMWVYGFGPDEFWYLTPTPYRSVVVSVDGQNLVSMTPFPYINTGGINLFLWRPITSDFTLSDRPYEVNVSGALGLIEGTHTFNATVTGWLSGSTWLVGAALILTTSPNAGAASASPPSFHSSSGTSGATVSGTGSFAFTSNFSLGSNTVSYASSGSWNFSNTMLASGSSSSTSWQNLTQLEGWSETTTASVGGSVSSDRRTYSFPVSMDLGSAFHETSSTNGSYPIYGNFTSYMLAVHQEWSELDQSSSATVGVAPFERSVDDVVAGTQGVYAGREELTSPNAALLLSINFISSSTTKRYTDVEGATGSGSVYDHLLSGVAYQPSNPDSAETVTANSVTSVLPPLSLSLYVVNSVGEVNLPFSVGALVAGGSGSYRVGWPSLPPAICPMVTQVDVTCTPLTADRYWLYANVTDEVTGAVDTGMIEVLVFPALAASILSSSPAIDAGNNVTLNVSISGGVAPYACGWSAPNSVTLVDPSECILPFSPPTGSPGPLNVQLTVDDALGAQRLLSDGLTVESPMAVAVTGPSASIPAGNGADLTASISGGASPYVVTWSVNGADVSGVTGTNFTFVPPSAGRYSIVATVSDSTPTGRAVSVPFLLSAGGPSTSSSASSSTDTWLWIALAAVAAVAAIELVALLARRPRRPAPPVPRAAPPPPTAGR